MTEPVKPGRHIEYVWCEACQARHKVESGSGVEAAPTREEKICVMCRKPILMGQRYCEGIDNFAHADRDICKRNINSLSPETPAMPNLVTVIERIANCGSVEDFTVAGIRAELRDALHEYRYGSVETPREEK